MSDQHRQFFQQSLTQNAKSITTKFGTSSSSKSRPNVIQSKSKKKDKSDDIPHLRIDHITLNNTAQLTNTDALNIIEWLGVILSSPDNPIRSVNFDLRNNDNSDALTGDAIIDSQCIYKFCDSISRNPSKSLNIESLEFHSVPMTSQDVQNLFDVIRLKCKYCSYLALDNCDLNGDDVAEIIYHHYHDHDFYGLRNGSLQEIDLYDNHFSSSKLFHFHPLVTLNRKMKSTLRAAIKAYGDFLKTENVLIHTNDRYFWFCLLPNLRMTMGCMSRHYHFYYRLSSE